MQTFDIARLVYGLLEGPLEGRVALGRLNVRREDVAAPLSVIHVQKNVPNESQKLNTRLDIVKIVISTMIDASSGELYSRMEPHLNALRTALFADRRLARQQGVIEVQEGETVHDYNPEELVYLVDLTIEIKYRREAGQP